jgi:hypothetical protein
MSDHYRETTLDDLLDDPITVMMMTSDGIGRDELRAALASVALRRTAAGIPSLLDHRRGPKPLPN